MKKILIVDDEPALADLIAEFCRQADFEARVETDSSKAYDIALEWRPDLITLDLEMPKANGMDVLRRLLSTPETARIPVIIISVVAKGALDAGLLDGVRLVFEKPLRFQKLVDKLQEVVRAPFAPMERRAPFLPYTETILPHA